MKVNLDIMELNILTLTLMKLKNIEDFSKLKKAGKMHLVNYHLL